MRTQVIISHKDYLKLQTLEKENLELRQKLCCDPKSQKFIQEFEAKKKELNRLIISSEEEVKLVQKRELVYRNTIHEYIKISNTTNDKINNFNKKIKKIPKLIRSLFKLDYENL